MLPHQQFSSISLGWWLPAPGASLPRSSSWGLFPTQSGFGAERGGPRKAQPPALRRHPSGREAQTTREPHSLSNQLHLNTRHPPAGPLTDSLQASQLRFWPYFSKYPKSQFFSLQQVVMTFLCHGPLGHLVAPPHPVLFVNVSQIHGMILEAN